MLEVIILEPDAMVSRILTEAVTSLPDLKLTACVTSLKQLSRAVSENGCHILIGEVHLPDGELISWILSQRKSGNTLEILPVTGDTNSELFYRFRALGASDYILKPFTPARVRQALKRCLYVRETILPDKKITQKKIDRLQQGTAASDEGVFRGRASSQKRIEQAIYGFGGAHFTVEHIQDKTGLSASTVRRYLEPMVKEGQIGVFTDFGAVGRPVYQYYLIHRG